MTPAETLTHLLTLTDPTPEQLREASDLALMATGWTVKRWVRDGETAVWTSPDGQRFYGTELPNPAASIDDAVRWMVPEGYRVFLERLPVDSGPSWMALVRAHGKVGDEFGWTDHPALALTFSALAARLEDGK